MQVLLLSLLLDCVLHGLPCPLSTSCIDSRASLSPTWARRSSTAGLRLPHPASNSCLPALGSLRPYACIDHSTRSTSVRAATCIAPFRRGSSTSPPSQRSSRPALANVWVEILARVFPHQSVACQVRLYSFSFLFRLLQKTLSSPWVEPRALWHADTSACRSPWAFGASQFLTPSHVCTSSPSVVVFLSAERLMESWWRLFKFQRPSTLPKFLIWVLFLLLQLRSLWWPLSSLTWPKLALLPSCLDKSQASC